MCIATFDSTIHFYSMRPGQAQPHMLVVPDVTDVYCPLSGNVVVNLKESRPLVRVPGGQPACSHSDSWSRLYSHGSMTDAVAISPACPPARLPARPPPCLPACLPAC